MKPLFLIFWLSLSLIIGGCAVSPQTIVLRPQATLTGPFYGQGRVLTIEVEDHRTSVITIANDINAALLLAAQDSAAQLGFDGSSSAAPAHLRLILKELSYDTRTKGIINTISLDAKITLITSVGDSSHTGHYQTQRSHQFPQLPDAQKNQQIISEVLSTSLERGFSDISLANFLAKN
jgi:uncharacterized lipoprotein